jgi:tRNA U34 2-thiouridine synthase MnmA/TrmU
MEKYEGIVLYSGGLDSILAYRVLAEQGLSLLAVKFHSFFFPLKSGPEEYKREQKENFGVEVEVHEVTEDFLAVVREPRFGYGRWMNPCLDCKLFMYRRSAKIVERTGAKFIATGEVLGQRPMTQHRGELNRLAKEAGLKGVVLRPLCAQLLPETEVEKSGLVNRSRLLDISGRGRRRQMRLASEKGITGYPTPAGGCYLTDETFARRLKDMFIHGDDTRSLPLLHTGRHFRLSETCRLTVGRRHEENLFIEKHAEDADALLVPLSHMGPSAAAHGTCSSEEMLKAARIVARYGDAPLGEKSVVKIQAAEGSSEISVSPLEEESIIKMRI